MITDRIRLHEVLLPINHNFNKICDKTIFKSKQEIPEDLFLPAVKKGHLSARILSY